MAPDCTGNRRLAFSSGPGLRIGCAGAGIGRGVPGLAGECQDRPGSAKPSQEDWGSVVWGAQGRAQKAQTGSCVSPFQAGMARGTRNFAQLGALGRIGGVGIVQGHPPSPPPTPGMGQWVNNCSKNIIALAQRGPGWSPHPTNWTLLVPSPVMGTRGSPAAPPPHPRSHSLVAGGNFKSWGRN